MRDSPEAKQVFLIPSHDNGESGVKANDPLLFYLVVFAAIVIAIVALATWLSNAINDTKLFF